MRTFSFSTLFDDPEKWQVFASGQAKGFLSRIEGPGSEPGVRLDYDFHGGGGFVVIRRVVALKLPETFTIGFRLRGGGPPNHFEFKVASPGGANVWRHLSKDHGMADRWEDFRFNERGLPFAWGPAGGGGPSDVEAIEIVVAAGPGGQGWIELADALLEDQTLRKAESIRASSHRLGAEPEHAFEAGGGEWRAAEGDVKPWWAVDFGRPQRFGGVVIDWPEGLPPRELQLEVSGDGIDWTLIHRAGRAMGRRSHISTPGAEARHLRLVFAHPGGAALARVSLRPDAFSSTPNEFIHSVAADFPRGLFPRYWHREQSYWTPVGSPDGGRRALVNEEGMVEVDEGGFSLEPFLLTDGKLVTWADVETSVSMEKHGVPMPKVTWRGKGLRLEILPWMDGSGEGLTLRTTYRLRLKGQSSGWRLVIAIRPYQVNPPWQAFRNLGGRSPLMEAGVEEGGVRVDGRKVTGHPAPDSGGVAAFEEGQVTGFLMDGRMPPEQRVRDEEGLASAAMVWEVPAGVRSFEVTVSMPYHGEGTPLLPGGRRKAHARWRRVLGRVEWTLPESARDAFDCMRCAAGHILIHRDGAAIQPGPRRYTRSWVRDCVIMGAALMKAGLPRPLREFMEWYAPFQREDGFVPCVVDRDGIDWLVEHDSHGQFLWGAREVCRDGGDRRFLEQLMPRVGKAAEFLTRTRRQRMSEGPGGEFHGLLPESASHEGYLAHPVHSYWDDFWGVRGLEAAADLAEASGDGEGASRWRREAVEFQNDLLSSIRAVIESRKLAYIPGSVEWADFDPTATSNAVAMLDFADVLPEDALHSMLATYLEGFRRKHGGGMEWNNYTAYEIRIIGAFVRLGERATANELLSFFLRDRRPREWNQWPEITWRDPRAPGHLGDVPHTWIAAEYLLALCSMVAADREASDALVLASGMPWEWIAEAGGFSVRKLPTRHGALDFGIDGSTAGVIRVWVGGIGMPSGGLSIRPPLPGGGLIAAADGLVLHADGLGVDVARLPCEALLVLGPQAGLA